MIYSISGLLRQVAPTYCVVEACGVGYQCSASTHTLSSLPGRGQEVTLLTHLCHRQHHCRRRSGKDPGRSGLPLCTEQRGPHHHHSRHRAGGCFPGYHGKAQDGGGKRRPAHCGAYDSAFMFKYSERPGTYASKHLPDDVPEEVKIRRLNEIIELQNQLSAESNAKDVGKTFEVMVEGVSKRSKEQLFGRTQQNKVVVFDRGNHRIGDFVNVRITEASSATLKGEEVF